MRGSHWKRFSWTCELGVAGSQVITRVRRMVLSRLMETSDLALACACQHFGLQRQPPDPCSSSTHPEASQSIPPYMFLALYELLPLRWSPKLVVCEQVNPCTAPKGKCLGLQQPSVLLGIHCALIFTARSYTDSSSWHWCPDVSTAFFYFPSWPEVLWRVIIYIPP